MTAKKRCQKKINLSWYATKSELEKVHYVMKAEGRNTVSDCIRFLVNDRFSFLTSNINVGINNPVVVADKE